ncbi:MAG: TetR/AcrR family transcriptional regulator [Actinomycetaceae bacterium]|nr:TetR/AcrR family transcriptional regulator [Actinomycetaceae bacterium]
MSVFGEHGYRNGSLQEIGNRVGMTHSGVLHHFGSKTNLLLEVVRFRDKSDLEEIDREEVPEGEELFQHLMRTVQINSKRPGVVQTYAVLSAESVTDDHPAKDYFIERFYNLREKIAEAIRQWYPDKVFSDDRLRAAASALIGAMDGIQTQWLLDPEHVDLVESTRLAVNAIVAQVVDEPRERFA